MRKCLVCCLSLVCIIIFASCYNTAHKEEPLAYIAGVQNMLIDISTGNQEDAWGRIYKDMADPLLRENLELCARLFNGREIKRCDCYDYERTGDRSGEGGVYSETTYYKIYMTEDYSGEPDFYAKAVGICDDNGDGIISFEIYENCP